MHDTLGEERRVETHSRPAVYNGSFADTADSSIDQIS